jgi:hypothetical protein
MSPGGRSQSFISAVQCNTSNTLAPFLMRRLIISRLEKNTVILPFASLQYLDFKSFVLAKAIVRNYTQYAVFGNRDSFAS